MTEELDLRTRLNTETARIGWGELERHFARGAIVVVSPDLDLVEVAACFVEDRRDDVAHWMERDDVHAATSEEAAAWAAGEAELWAVVVAPWVLVQARRSATQ